MNKQRLFAFASAVLMFFSIGITGSATAVAAPEGYELLFMNAQDSTALTASDRKAIYGQFNFNVGADGASLVFSDAEQCPPLLVEGGDIQVATEDLNGDGYPEVIVSLGSSCMYGAAGIGVTLFIKDKAGRWQPHNLGAGMYSVQESQHQGYADLMLGGPGFCHPVLAWNGTTYVFDRKQAEQPGGCDGQ
jgi:hypothetical protein